LDEPRIADRFMASLILPVQTAVRITLVREQEDEDSWTVDRITQVARDVLGVDNRFYAHATDMLPGGTAAEVDQGRAERGYRGSGRGSSARDRRSPDHRFKRPERGGVAKKYHCEQHGSNDTHGSKDCQFLKFKKARAEGKCVKCCKPYDRSTTK
ncbi:hypothetical protein MBANPS3_010881, partial [Mucor bainieri]